METGREPGESASGNYFLPLSLSLSFPLSLSLYLSRFLSLTFPLFSSSILFLYYLLHAAIPLLLPLTLLHAAALHDPPPMSVCPSLPRCRCILDIPVSRSRYIGVPQLVRPLIHVYVLPGIQ